MRIIYLAVPLRRDVAPDLARGRRWLAWIYRQHPDVIVIAPWLYELELRGHDPQLTDARLRQSVVVARFADEVWLCGGQVTESMRLEAHGARAVQDLSDLGPEPPGDSA